MGFILEPLSLAHYHVNCQGKCKLSNVCGRRSLTSETPEGLQTALHKTMEFCEKWQLKINCDKTKIMIFNNGPGKLLFYRNRIARNFLTPQCITMMSPDEHTKSPKKSEVGKYG